MTKRASSAPITGTHFSFAFDQRYRRPAQLFGVTPENCTVVVGAEFFEARFGRWRLRTPLCNIRTTTSTGPYRFFKTAGPARLAITDRGLTFATNGECGVQLDFVEPVAGIEPTGRLRHPNLTVTVADCTGLVREIAGSGAA